MGEITKDIKEIVEDESTYIMTTYLEDGEVIGIEKVLKSAGSETGDKIIVLSETEQAILNTALTTECMYCLMATQTQAISELSEGDSDGIVCKYVEPLILSGSYQKSDMLVKLTILKNTGHITETKFNQLVAMIG